MTTAHVEFLGGFLCVTPNICSDLFRDDKLGVEFYVSYNSYDKNIYGRDTTALVMVVPKYLERFFVLNGDHRAGYRAIATDGMVACMDYFVDHVAEVNMYTEPRPWLPFPAAINSPGYPRNLMDKAAIPYPKQKKL